MYRHEYLVIYTQHFNLSNNLCWQHSSGKIPDAASIGQGADLRIIGKKQWRFSPIRVLLGTILYAGNRLFLSSDHRNFDCSS